MNLGIAKLTQIKEAAMLKAVSARENGAETENRASDFGQLARHWERLADSADSLTAILERIERWETGGEPPKEPQ